MVLNGHEIWANGDIHNAMLDDSHRNVMNPFDTNSVRFLGHVGGNNGTSGGGGGVAPTPPLTHISTNGYYGYHTVNASSAINNDTNNNNHRNNGDNDAAEAMIGLQANSNVMRAKKRHCVDPCGDLFASGREIGHLDRQFENGFLAKRHCPSSGDAWVNGASFNPIGMDVDDMFNGSAVATHHPFSHQQQATPADRAMQPQQNQMAPELHMQPQQQQQLYFQDQMLKQKSLDRRHYSDWHLQEHLRHQELAVEKRRQEEDERLMFAAMHGGNYTHHYGDAAHASVEDI